MTLSVMQVLHQGSGAGSVSSTVHLSFGLARSGFHVRFVCPPDSEVYAMARAGGLEVHPLTLEAKRSWANAAGLERLLGAHPVDLINSQSSRDRGALAWLAMVGRLKVPLVITRRQMPRTLAFRNWWISRAATRIVAVSRSVGDALVRHGTSRKKLVIIPNGLITTRVDIPVPPAVIEEWRARIGWEPSRRTIGIVARLKDQEVVLRALNQVTIPVRLVLAGVPPSHRLQHLVSKVRSPHAVVMLPFTPAVRPLYELLELVLLPSRIEGLSQALLEAMALGKAVIASAAAGNRDLITDGVDGRLVAALDPSAWARAIQKLLSDEATANRLGRAAWHTARETYALERTVQRTGELYRSLVGIV